MSKIKFVCPNCGSNSGVIAEITITQYREVTVYETKNGDVDIEIRNEDLEGGIDYDVESFMCWDCDEFIAWNKEGLLKYLKEHDMLEE